jgi:hypothetical protein
VFVDWVMGSLSRAAHIRSLTLTSIGVTPPPTHTNIILRGIIKLSNVTATTNGNCCGCFCRRHRRQRLTRSVFDEPLGWLKHRRFYPCSYFQPFEFFVVAASMKEGEVEVVVVASVVVVVVSSMLITSLVSEEEDEDTRDGLSTAVVVVVVNDDNVDATSTWK